MLISESQFREGLKNPENLQHNIIFLGMSGAGKTHWSRILAEEYKLKHIEFDQLIALSKEFSNLIKDIPGKDENEKMGNYFGRPGSEGFKLKEEKYLDIEKRFMAERFPHGVILDLTGSAIYHTFELKRVDRTGLIIYLQTSKEAQQEMFEMYINDPKPVCWKGMFQKNSDESDEEALTRCYPMLLEYRTILYEKYADITLPFDVHKNLTTMDMFVEEVCRQLRNQKN